MTAWILIVVPHSVGLRHPWGTGFALGVVLGHITGVASWIDRIDYWLLIPVFIVSATLTMLCWLKAGFLPRWSSWPPAKGAEGSV